MSQPGRTWRWCEIPFPLMFNLTVQDALIAIEKSWVLAFEPVRQIVHPACLASSLRSLSPCDTGRGALNSSLFLPQLVEPLCLL